MVCSCRKKRKMPSLFPSSIGFISLAYPINLSSIYFLFPQNILGFFCAYVQISYIQFTKKCTHFCPFVYKYKTWVNLQEANNIFSSGLMILLVPPSKSSKKNYHSHKKHTAKCILFSISKSKPFS